MAGGKIKAKIKTVLKPSSGSKPMKMEGGDAGLLSARIIAVVKKEKESQKNESERNKQTKKG